MARHFQGKEKRTMGLGRQDVIRYFFGGNAMVSIVVLFLICVFLAREAVLFFPQHHKNLKLYRQSGQEYVGHLIKESDEYARLVSWTNQAYYQELDKAYGLERGLTEGFEVLSEVLEDEGEDLIDEWYEAREEAEAQSDPSLVKTIEAKWLAFVEETLTKAKVSETDICNRLDEASQRKLLVSMKEWDPVEETPPALIEEAERAMQEGMAAFEKARAGVAAAGQELTSLRDRLREVASAITKEVVAGRTAEARLQALTEGVKNAKTEEDRNRLQEEADKIVLMESFPFQERTRVLEESKEEHRQAVAHLKEKLTAAVDQLPAELKSDQAALLLEQVREGLPSLLGKMDESVARADAWQYDRELSGFGSAMKFFFGREWVTNSSWHDFYGLLPLLSGSLLISMIALLVAVPFSIGAAIYVNRLARPWEQAFIKPAIEMIQAIPSVVLGFFGIVVLGEGLRELSQIEWLSWVPGFPMQERLNILNAGLLLALMAVPTIFTLCEDALNNVPRAFSEASLALGASQLQTVLKVILPTAISGILAAILLGFGRVIGETMVVLLVAGNQIAIPDFSQGLGVVTQPAHTMTGIIAQEMGEVSKGTLHWRGLFLVGLVLFTISLLINITAQRVIRRLGHA